MTPSRPVTRAFTLLELLIVVSLVAGVSFFLLRGILPGGANSLQSGQTQVASLVTAARMKASASGKRARILFHVDPVTNPNNRFLRFYVLQIGSENSANPTSWTTVDAGYLPENVFVVPSSLSVPAGLVSNRNNWKKTSVASEDLVSDMLAQTSSLTVDGDAVPQTWAGFVFTPNGTLAPFSGSIAPKGNLVLAMGAMRAPQSFSPGESPVVLQQPSAVRGMAFSVYGIPTLLNDQSSF